MQQSQCRFGRMSLHFVVVMLLGLLCSSGLGCGGGGGGSSSRNITTTSTVTVAVNPTPANLPINGRQTFTSIVTGSGNTAVTWSVQEGASGGSITSVGVYTAPATAGVYHIVATSVADPTRSASVAVTVHLIVAVTPPNSPITLGQSTTLTATITGSTNTGVSWSVQEGASGGTVSAAGVFTAANTPGTFHVIATSQADSTQSASAAVVVQAGSASGTIQ